MKFDTFTSEEALSLGMILVNYAEENNKAAAIHIERNRVQLFTHLTHL
ncbi:hypothetical protein GJU41_21200 [Bacillus idriensis]|uniref:Uncharacterized protein n=1 Tax=Metabacillus idriensis TaxID=324768 RepID=A0A6I2MFB6_9BACI|nr:hypothetical protein [Metabacillus idriensis]MRX56479.1 hypothetical protein [Metabacillus idriensis]